MSLLSISIMDKTPTRSSICKKYNSNAIPRSTARYRMMKKKLSFDVESQNEIDMLVEEMNITFNIQESYDFFAKLTDFLSR